MSTRDQRRDLGLDEHVTVHVGRAVSDSLRERLALDVSAPGDHHRGAFIHEQRRDGCADAARPAQHYHCFVVNSAHIVLPFCIDDFDVDPWLIRGQ